MKKIIKILFVISFFSARIFAQTGNEQPAIKDTNNTQLKFAFQNNVYDFGGIEKYGTARYEFQFKNSGNTPLIIADMHSSANGIYSPAHNIHVSWPKKPVKPGKKGLITVTLTSQDDIGSFENDIYITSNATPPDYPILHITGAVTPVSGQMTEPKEKPPIVPIELLWPVIKANTPP